MPRTKKQADSMPKPQGRMTSYAFFLKTCREEEKKKHPDGKVVFSEFSRKCADQWKSMSEKQKQPYLKMAERDKQRYDKEMKSYVPPKGEKGRGKKRGKKDPNAPKRYLSAFFWFSKDERPNIKRVNPDYGIGEIGKELGRLWAEAAPGTKSKYQAMSDRDKARYEKEMAEYKKKGKAAAPVADDEEDEDDDDEEEEEDDDDE